MKILKVKNYEELSKAAARYVAAQIIIKPNSVVGLATGSTPIGLYKEMVRMNHSGEIDFSQVMTVNLDEYKGIGPNDEQSYSYFMNEHLFEHVNIYADNIHIPASLHDDDEQVCKDYDDILNCIGPIDLQLLGIGHSAHIGFNEPADHFTVDTQCVVLSEKTLKANKRFFNNNLDAVPKKAYTMGIGSIMRAKKILMIVSGKDKAEVLHQTIYGPVKPQVPASVLQLHHNVLIIADEDALSY